MSQSIEGRHDRRKVILPVVLLPPEPTADLTGIDAFALLDTGATASGVTERIAKQLALKAIGKRPLGFARGEAQVERYVFRVGIRPPSPSPTFPFIFDEVTGFELSDSFSLDALIGMDILSQCDFKMERGGRWSLAFG